MELRYSFWVMVRQVHCVQCLLFWILWVVDSFRDTRMFLWHFLLMPTSTGGRRRMYRPCAKVLLHLLFDCITIRGHIWIGEGLWYFPQAKERMSYANIFQLQRLRIFAHSLSIQYSETLGNMWNIPVGGGKIPSLVSACFASKLLEHLEWKHESDLMRKTKSRSGWSRGELASVGAFPLR